MSDWNPAAGPASEPLPVAAAEPRYPFWGYSDLLLFAAAAAPAIVLSAFVVASLRFVLPEVKTVKALQVLLVQFLAYGLWFFCLYALLRIRHGRPFWESLAWAGTRQGIASGLFTGPLVALMIAAIGVGLGTPRADVPMMELLSDRWSIVLVGIFAVSLGPLCEELAFRGFLLPLVSRSFGPAAGIVLAAAPFAVLHGPQYGWSWQHVLLVGLAGVAFGWVRYRTGSTAAATAMHATYNLTFFTGFLIARGERFYSW